MDGQTTPQAGNARQAAAPPRESRVGGIDKARRVLKRVYGYDSFRSGQEDVISSILGRHDTVAIMPTGAGKSLCYQIPALMLAGVMGGPGIGMSIVISPLKSLMRDQVSALQAVGVSASYLNSSLAPEDEARVMADIAHHRVTLLYCAPERLVRRDFRELIAATPVALVAVDEAHCVSQWGHDFRPEYRQIRDFLETCTPRAVVAAFTATATEHVREDIVSALGLRDPAQFKTSFDRPNLWFGTKKLPRRAKDDWIVSFARDHADQSGIVYCASRRETEELADALAQAGINAAAYHAGLPDERRSAVQDAFIDDDIRVIVATNAFGMGIDKPDVRYVLHHNMPSSIEEYYQEAGRAGRDGDPGRCMLLWNDGDVSFRMRQIDNTDREGDMPDADREMLRTSRHDLLNAMIGYCGTTGCLRASLLGYFGETAPRECGNCSNCDGEFESVDVTREAVQVMRCVQDLGQRVGKGTVASVLHGAQSEAVAKRGYDRAPSYGALRSSSLPFVKDVIAQMVADGYLAVHLSNGAYPVLVFGPRADDAARGDFHYEIKREAAHTGSGGSGRGSGSGWRDGGTYGASSRVETVKLSDPELFDRLRELRSAIAKESGKPPYMVFNDRSLREMAELKPTDADAFLAINGVGERKLEAYGERFMEAIRGYMADKG